MRKKIVIFGHYGVPNWGDEAILSGILSQINISDFSVTVISHSPEYTKKLHNVHSAYPPPFGIRSFLNFKWIQTLKIIKEADYIVIGGGGLWQPKPLKALSLWNFYLQICLFFEKKVLSLGTSFSVLSENTKELENKNFKNTYNKILEKTEKLLKKIKFFSVRDTQSKIILLDTYNIHEAKIATTADAAFFLEPENFFLEKEKKKNIVLAMREEDLTLEQEKTILKSLYKHFNPKTYSYTFLVMQSHQSQDEKFVTRHKNIEILYPKNLSEVLGVIYSAHFVCSSRLHANILASVCNTNFLAISCRDKVKNLFSEYLSENIIESVQIKNTKKYMNQLNKKITTLCSSQKYSFLEKNKKFLEVQKKKLQNFFPDILQ